MVDPLSFQDLEPGLVFETGGRTVTAADIDAFAALSGDTNPLHLDAHYAATTPFGARVAHGLLVLSLVSGLSYRLQFMGREGAALTGIEWKLRAPVKIGDTIRARITVRRKRALPGYDGGLVILDVLVLNAEEEVVQEGSWTVLVSDRG